MPLDLIREAEELGFDSCWTSEAYGSDAVSVSTWILAQTTRIKVGTAILQLPARTPTTVAMTAMSLQQLSGGRFIVGIGPSGPQVVEGWYGASYAKPLTRLHEYIDIMRLVFAREKPVQYERLPLHVALWRGGLHQARQAPEEHPRLRGKIPIYTASLQPKAVALSAEIADGFFPIWLNPEKPELFSEPIEEGLDESSQRQDASRTSTSHRSWPS